MKHKVVRTATIPLSLNLLLKGQLEFLNKHYDVFAISGPGIDLQVVEAREKVVIRTVVFERKISLLKDLRSLISLYMLLRKLQPTFVHSITPKAGLISMTAAYLAGVPIRMHTFTGLIFPSKKGLMRKLLIVMDKLLCFFATNIYPEGEGVKKDLITYNVTRKPLKVIANGNINGVDTEYYNSKSVDSQSLIDIKFKLKIQEDDFVFIFVGRLVADKGINELVYAFNELREEVPRVKLLLVGSLEQELDPLSSETIKIMQANEDIIMVGFQEDVRPYYAISDVLTFPSYREGFPNVVLQAGAMNLPSIVTDINGCNEIISHGKNGLIISVKNKIMLKSEMIRIIEDEDLRKALASNARRVAVERFEKQYVWNEILAEYRRLEGNI